ncbi:Heme A synthase [Listeria monocytogenes N53-1]|nr:Heme A synthase [Listeria monocytogenes N53-1]
MAVPVWPFENGHFIMPTSVQDYVQYFHRLAAFILIVWLLYVTWLVFRVLTFSMVLSLVFIALQAVTGALSVYTGVNLYIALAHSLIITMLFALLCYLCLLASRSKSNRLRIK